MPLDRSVPPVRPLLVTGAAHLLDEALRLAAVAGVDLDVVADAGLARDRWSSAPLVLLGVDAVPGCLRQRLPRRDGVVLLGDDLDDARVWQVGVEVGAAHVAVLPGDEDAVLARLADAAEGGAGAGTVIAVTGGRGGAGATTLACALAVTAARAGERTLLVDADPLGGGVDLVFGAEAERGLRWPDLGQARGRLSAPALVEALPRASGLQLLSWDRGATPAVHPDAVAAVLRAARRAYDLVVVDLPRGGDDAVRHVLHAADHVLLVVPAEVRATAAAGRVAASAGLLCSDLRVVVRAPGPGGLDGGAVARALGLPLAGQLRPEPGLDAALEHGEPPAARGRGPLAELCGRLLVEFAPALRQAA